MTKERWAEVRSKGIWSYVLHKGVLELGFGGGLLVVTLKYLSDSGFSLGRMSFGVWASEYLIWMPIALFVGFLMSIYIWFDFEEKFGSRRP